MSANITKSSNVRLADIHAPLRLTALAGEVIADGSPVFLHTDGTFHKAVSTSVGIANLSKFDGIVVSGATAAGLPCTAFGVGAKIHIAEGTLTIGQFVYVSATAGALYDAKVATADGPVAKAITTSDIEVIRML